MKKVILALYVLIFTTATLFAQTQIPHHVMDAFKQSHPGANRAAWTTDGANFKVSYLDESKMQNFKVYDSNDKVISHQYELMGNAIPKEIVQYYQSQNVPDGSYKFWTVIDQDGSKRTFGELNGVITNFDKSGNAIK